MTTMQATRLPSPTKRSIRPVENAAEPPIASPSPSTSTKTRPRRPSVKDIRDGPVTQHPRPTAGPPSSFKIPPKPAPAHQRASSLGRSPSAGAGAPTPTGHSRNASVDRSLSSRHMSASSSAANERSYARRTSSQSRPSATTPVGTRRSSTSSSAAGPPPMQRPLAQGTANRTHARAASVQESSTNKTPAKPSFSTYQQNFTPAKKLPPSSSSSASRRVASVTSGTASPKLSSASTPRHTSTAPDEASPKAPAQTLEHLRAQTNLLQLSLLHRDFQANFRDWSTSAHDKLNARFASLQSNYASSLSLARAVRQSRNILALHRWTNGNVASLARKLAALAEILRQVCELTADGYDDDDTAADAGPPNGGEAPTGGDFTRLTRQFDAWTSFVQSVWAARDHQTPRPSGEDSPPWTPAAREMLQPRGRRRSRDSSDGDKPDTAAIEAVAATPIPGLGDAFKTALRSVGSHLDRLALRLGELREPAIPLVSTPAGHGLPLDVGHADGDGDGAGAEHIPTPRYLADLVWELVRGMREEVQVMREAEFEVDIGEKAWTEQRVRNIERDVQGGWGTPSSSSMFAAAQGSGSWGSPLPASLAGAF